MHKYGAFLLATSVAFSTGLVLHTPEPTKTSTTTGTLPEIAITPAPTVIPYSDFLPRSERPFKVSDDGAWGNVKNLLRKRQRCMVDCGGGYCCSAGQYCSLESLGVMCYSSMNSMDTYSSLYSSLLNLYYDILTNTRYAESDYSSIVSSIYANPTWSSLLALATDFTLPSVVFPEPTPFPSSNTGFGNSGSNSNSNLGGGFYTTSGVDTNWNSDNDFSSDLGGAGFSTSRKKKKGLSGGAIAGIVIGVLIILFVVAVALFFVYRRNKKNAAISQAQAQAAAGAASNVNGFYGPTQENKPVMAAVQSPVMAPTTGQSTPLPMYNAVETEARPWVAGINAQQQQQAHMHAQQQAQMNIPYPTNAVEAGGQAVLNPAQQNHPGRVMSGVSSVGSEVAAGQMNSPVSPSMSPQPERMGSPASGNPAQGQGTHGGYAPMGPVYEMGTHRE